MRHVQNGIPRRNAPWVPPYMRTAATAPNRRAMAFSLALLFGCALTPLRCSYSPGKVGLIGNSPKELVRCGGGYVEVRPTPTLHVHACELYIQAHPTARCIVGRRETSALRRVTPSPAFNSARSSARFHLERRRTTHLEYSGRYGCVASLATPGSTTRRALTPHGTTCT
jgi:hypothetical protein